MKKKKDLYIDFNQSYYKKNRKKYRADSESKRTAISVILVIAASIILGYGAYYMTSQILINRDDTLKVQERLRRQTEGEIHDVAEGASDGMDEGSKQNDGAGNDVLDIDENSIVDNLGGDKNSQNESIGNNSSQQENEESMGEDTAKEEAFMPDFVDTRTPVKVKGIYVTGPRAGTDKYMSDLIQLVDTTELNSMIIDIKNDNGEITYNMDLKAVQDMDADIRYIPNIEQLIGDLKAKDIYLIARIVAFKDPTLAERRPELSLKKKDGSIFRDKEGLAWVNPYEKKVWEYLVDISKEATRIGFDEIQFDYIRFSTDASMKDVDFGPSAKDKSKMEIISEFTKYACKILKPLGVFVSADVYGTIIDSKIDAEIVGQDYVQMSKYLDYICPMIYPSHYANGAYGIDYPDLEPYNLIKSVLNKSQSVLSVIDEGKNKAVVRSWLQDFTASWIKNYQSYGPEQIREQIKGVYDAGYEEWILWNGNTNYTKDGLLAE